MDLVSQYVKEASKNVNSSSPETKGQKITHRLRTSLVALLAIAGVLLLVTFALLSLSLLSVTYDGKVSVSVTTLDLPENPLNFSGYQIKNPGVSYITLAYSFPPGSGTGELNLSSIWGNMTTGSYTACNFPANKVVMNDCGVNIIPVEPEIRYYSDLYARVSFEIIVEDNATTGSYLFFPAGGICNYFIYLVIGNRVPREQPSLTFMGCLSMKPIPEADISVVGIQNMIGLNISQ